MAEFQQTMMAKMQEAQKREAEDSKIKGAEFLAAKAATEGIKKTESGLLYQVLEEGAGESPKATDTVRVHYVGTLIDGTEFDSSVRRGQPYTTPLNQVVSGWTEGIQLMTKGAKYQFWIPGELGYGSQGSPPRIPPNAVLVFEVELLDFK